MTYSESQKRATMKYQREKMDQIAIRVKKGDREKLKAEAETQGQSMAQYVVQAVNDRAGYQVLTPAEATKPQQEE